MKQIPVPIVLIAATALSACGGSTTGIMREDTYEFRREFYEGSLSGRAGPQVLISDLPLTGEGKFSGYLNLTATDVDVADGAAFDLALGQGTVTVAFSATDPTLSGTFSNFIAANEAHLDGTVTITSTGTGHSGTTGGLDNRFEGTVTGSVSGTDTGTVFDNPRDFAGYFNAYPVGTDPVNIVGGLFGGNTNGQLGRFFVVRD